MENGLTVNLKAMASKRGQMAEDMKVSGSKENQLEKVLRHTRMEKPSVENGKVGFS
jgi:hypothetical protein